MGVREQVVKHTPGSEAYTAFLKDDYYLIHQGYDVGVATTGEAVGVSLDAKCLGIDGELLPLARVFDVVLSRESSSGYQ